MFDFSSIFVGLVCLATIILVLLVHDWRDEYQKRMAAREHAHRHPLHEWWRRHRH
ncbi:hypothetical protein AWB79_01489 [Caballeronia hypogeia]|uniref:Uncharacterized protein n=1 Tax=Caballeronia hypogeia TaxID=1777140 RepID=A0A157ZWJ3_9BURK|nr:hypothetical protein [Caballeronia hypogeia]SAK49875.1 hypothetical protein AWB79_01489 [Caballeronia hypogeia]